MIIRKAEVKDIPQIIKLLEQVNLIHHKGRPDLFKKATKYNNSQLEEIICDESRPILVADDGVVLGYAFCVFQQNVNDNLLTDVKTLYLDDLCVDENQRGKRVGKTLFNAVTELAKTSGCYNVTLNVWSLNPSALKFYEACGMSPLKVYMEKIID